MARVRQCVSGERPRRALWVVLAVGVGVAALLAPFGIFEVGVSGRAGRAAFVLAFGVMPGIGGVVCGWYRLGYPGAAACGVAPGVAFVGVVAVGATLGVGSFGGGDSPLVPFALVLTAPGFLLATVGFVLGVAGARFRAG